MLCCCCGHRTFLSLRIFEFDYVQLTLVEKRDVQRPFLAPNRGRERERERERASVVFTHTVCKLFCIEYSVCVCV